MTDVILALDAGGTKTKVAAIDNDKRVVFETVGNVGSPAVDLSKAVSHIFDLVITSLDQIKNRYCVKHIYIGMSGFSIIPNVTQLEEEMNEAFGISVTLLSDTKMALYSFIKDKTEEGILMISGTGSACYGQKGNKELLVGGWGHLLGESGSSYSSVRRLLLDAIKQYDLGKPYTDLQMKIMQKMQVKDANGFRIYVYHKSKKEVAALAPIISDAAANQNKEAIEILRETAREIVWHIVTVYERLGLSNQAYLGFCGSFIHRATQVKKMVIEELLKNGCKLHVVEEEEDPIFGAYYLHKRSI